MNLYDTMNIVFDILLATSIINSKTHIQKKRFDKDVL